MLLSQQFVIHRCNG